MGYERLNLKTGQVITEDVFAHLEDGIEGAANAVLMTPILYADLVALRDARKLKAGMFYRITDYVTTTIQENTQSAGHAFDVIVMATDSQTLSEEARAIVHEGDTYFTEAGANLAAWKVWYCLDNDSERFAWADAENGKGVIYRLIDEWNNDCPYDFKNIQFIKTASFLAYMYGETITNTYERVANKSKDVNGVIYYAYKRTTYVVGPPPLAEEVWIDAEKPYNNMKVYLLEDGVMSESGYSLGEINESEYIVFTFCLDETFDYSLNSSFQKCLNNRISARYKDNKQNLNRIYFLSNTNSSDLEKTTVNNLIGFNCYDIRFLNNGSHINFRGENHNLQGDTYTYSLIVGYYLSDYIFRDTNNRYCGTNTQGTKIVKNIFD